MVARERVEGRDGWLGWIPTTYAPRSHGESGRNEFGLCLHVTVELKTKQLEVI